MRTRVPASACAALAAIAMLGCQADATPDAPPAGSSPTSVIADVRRATLRVAAGLHLRTVEFADASNGYATLVSRDPVDPSNPDDLRYASVMFATTDGGRTWKRLEDPRRPSRSPQMYVLDARTIVLLAEPDGWYVSTDGGGSFRFDPGSQDPPELAAHLNRNRGTYRLECETGCHLTANGSRLEPGLPGDLGGVSAAADGLVWAASLDGTSPYTAVSRDHGRTWQRREVPEHVGGQPARIRLTASRDGHDVWLVGQLAGGVGGVGTGGVGTGGVGTLAPLRRKDVGVPLLWLLEGERWVPKGTVGAPTPSLFPFDLAAIGGGLAAVTGPHGLALVGTAWNMVEMFPRTEWITTLSDGTVFGGSYGDRTFYLGTRTGSELRWTQLVFEG